MDNQSYVYKKEIDWSTLHQGINIPVSIQVIFQKNIEKFISRGQKKDINIKLEGKTYKAKLINQLFDKKKYPARKDILQIRYNTESELAVRLREIFYKSYSYILKTRNETNKKRKHIRIPDKMKEYLAIYTTVYQDTYILDCIYNETKYSLKEEVVNINEADFEYSINNPSVDPNAAIMYPVE